MHYTYGWMQSRLGLYVQCKKHKHLGNALAIQSLLNFQVKCLLHRVQVKCLLHRFQASKKYTLSLSHAIMPQRKCNLSDVFVLAAAAMRHVNEGWHQHIDGLLH